MVAGRGTPHIIPALVQGYQRADIRKRGLRQRRYAESTLSRLSVALGSVMETAGQVKVF